MLQVTPIRLLILAVILTGVGPVMVRDSPVGPASTGFWRLVIALPFSLWLARHGPFLSLPDTGRAILAGLLLAVDLILWNNAILSTSVMEATVLVMLFPIIIAAIEIGFLGRRLAPRLLIGGAIAFAGTAIIAIGASHGKSSFAGDMMAVVAAVFYAGSLLISAQLCQRANHRSVTAWVIVGSAVGTLPIGGAEAVFVPHDPYGWFYLALYGVLTFGSYAPFNSALSKLPTTLVAISGYGQPVIATGLAMILLGEIPTIGAALGSVVVVGGLLIAATSPPRK